MRSFISKYAKYVIIAAISFSIGALLPLAAEIRKSSSEKPAEIPKDPISTQSLSLSKSEQDQMIEVFKVWKLTSGLGLADSQLTSFLPKYKKLENARANFWNERRKTIDELKNLMQSDKKSEAQIKALLSKLRDLRLKFANDTDQCEGELTQGLSVEQQANFVILNDSFRQDIKQLTEKLKALNKNSDEQLRAAK